MEIHDNNKIKEILETLIEKTKNKELLWKPSDIYYYIYLPYVSKDSKDYRNIITDKSIHYYVKDITDKTDLAVFKLVGSRGSIYIENTANQDIIVLINHLSDLISEYIKSRVNEELKELLDNALETVKL